ncbi:MAG: hypothetical protein OEZ34_01045 [Spirochaetia bacterium]|nr:hypothetical protein [Spirochaetia bacterium]
MNENLQSGIQEHPGNISSPGRAAAMIDKYYTGGETTCRICGKKFDKLFQNNTCKSCLIDSFSRVKKIIDIYRTGYGENSSKKYRKNN